MDYEITKKQIEGFAEEEPHYASLMSNTAAVLFHEMNDINWAGFYLVDKEKGRLFLGPFQGNVACIHIVFERGVCGAAYREDRVMRVDNVNEFPGHIACDAASRSEIVLPIHLDGKVKAVLDIDSPSYSRFSEEDERGLKLIVDVLERYMEI